MLMGMRAGMATTWMRMGMWRKEHRQPIMDRRRMLRTGMGTSDVIRYEWEDGDDADTDAEEEASQADDGSIQNVED